MSIGIFLLSTFYILFIAVKEINPSPYIYMSIYGSHPTQSTSMPASSLIIRDWTLIIRDWTKCTVILI